MANPEHLGLLRQSAATGPSRSQSPRRPSRRSGRPSHRAAASDDPHRDQRGRVRRDRPYDALGSTGYENATNERGERHVWLAPNVVDRLRAMRGPGETYSDVILRLARA